MSLNERIALWGAMVLTLFMLLTAVALDSAYQDSTISTHEARLLGQLYLLVSAAEFGSEGLIVSEKLPEPRLSYPGSGLYAQVSDSRGRPLWRSPSLAGLKVPFDVHLTPGAKIFSESGGFFVESMGIVWVSAGKRQTFTFSIAEDLYSYHFQIARYRRSLAVRLGLISVLLLLTQAAVLRWGLSPLRRVAQELGEIQAGRRERLGKYPKDLSPLTESLNQLIRHERAQQMRYRDALADLAHSLKTPLAVMHAALEDEGLRETVVEQLVRMDRIVGHQLQRAATAAPSGFSAPCPVEPVVHKIVGSLERVHFEKKIDVEILVAPDLAYRVDESDLYEMLGNLADNAFKWCKSRVRIVSGTDQAGFFLFVEDDGPGIPEDAKVMERGARLDETVPGHGIGLAVVKDIAEAYGGKVVAARSDLGGALFSIRLPLR